MQTSTSTVEAPQTTTPQDVNKPADPKAAATDKPKALEVPLNADGTIGQLPKQLQDLIDGQISKAIQRTKEKTTGLDPVERERLKQAEDELQRLRVEEAERGKRYEEAIELRAKKFDEEKVTLQTQIERRNRRLQDMTRAEIRTAALGLGARKDALDDVAKILAERVAMDDELNTIVLDESGKPLPEWTIEQLVATVLEAKPFYKDTKPTGGGARGGASLSGHMVAGVAAAEQKALEEAQAKYLANRNDANLSAVFRAEQALKNAIKNARK